MVTSNGLILTNEKFQEAILDLIKFRELAAATNFSMIESRLSLFNEIISIKQSFFNIKALLLNTQVEIVIKPTLRVYIQRPINKLQLDGWLAKVQENFQIFVSKNTLDTDLNKAFINEQCFLIDTIVKVLNGDAYFTGCPQININNYKE